MREVAQVDVGLSKPVKGQALETATQLASIHSWYFKIGNN
jgi:hypothetical protein